MQDHSNFTYHDDTITYNNWSLNVDEDASPLLGPYWKGPVPVSVTGDGNCLFNSISVALTGHEGRSVELRLRTAIELILHKDNYVQTNSSTDIGLCSPDINDAIQECIKDKSFSSVWNLHAATTVTGKRIKSVYPVVNGPSDQCIGILNRVFNPRIEHPQNKKTQISIMWSGPQSKGIWTPHHFVPLLDNFAVKHNIVRLKMTLSVISMP
ncbi:hypothetical protein FSP39_022506 [Pinctada imbricata]|uniref:Vertnin n=1 Tax=Pinctada imbricata TaxID=66713 RepID=A0AA88Y136_PINIB|nr:hypothetical protein FSP39_022506 [Pinctada imbricata]